MEENGEVVEDMETKEMQNTGSSGKKLWYIVIAVVVILLAALAIGYFSKNKKVASVLTYPTPSASPTSSTSAEPSAQVTPIQTSQDINAALIQVDNADPSTVGTGLSQNSQDSAVFTQ